MSLINYLELIKREITLAEPEVIRWVFKGRFRSALRREILFEEENCHVERRPSGCNMRVASRSQEHPPKQQPAREWEPQFFNCKKILWQSELELGRTPDDNTGWLIPWFYLWDPELRTQLLQTNRNCEMILNMYCFKPPRQRWCVMQP